jgi:Predicted redox protein, regulator of disulfide bond formation
VTPSSKTFIYGVSLRREAGRQAHVESGGRVTIEVGPPGGFPGGDDARWSPEHLFLAALSSCMMLSFLAHADHADVVVEEYTSAIEGTIRRRADDHRYAFTAIQLRPRVVVGRGQLETARGALAKVERDCFITASTTAEVSIEWEIAEPAAA